MKKILLLLTILISFSSAQAYVGKIFYDDFEDDIEYDDGKPVGYNVFENGPPVNEGRPGRWIAGQWDNIDSQFQDQNWNINVVKDSVWTWYFGDPIGKPGKELFYDVCNLARFNDPFHPYNYYTTLNRDGFAKFTDALGNPVTAVAGQTIRGRFKFCRLGSWAAFGLVTDINAVVASTALEPDVVDSAAASGYKYPYGSLLQWDHQNLGTSEPWNPNLAAVLSMAHNAAGGQWFATLLPADITDFSNGLEFVALDSQNTGVNPYLAIDDNSDRQTDKRYQELYFEYTVGNDTWDVLRIDGVDIHVWQYNSVTQEYEQTDIPVPFGNYLGAAADGIDGFVLTHLNNYNRNPAFYDDFEFEIVNPLGELTSDLDEDMYVNSNDLEVFANQWLKAVTAFYDDFEDDIADDDRPFTTGPPANSGRPGRWIPGQWVLSSTTNWNDQNWNISVVNDFISSPLTSSPVPKEGNEAYFNILSGSEPDPNQPGIWNVAGFGAFTDENGNIIKAEVGDTLVGSFDLCVLAGNPTFVLTSDIEAMAADTANLPVIEAGEMIEGLSGYTITEPMNSNVVAQLLFMNGINQDYFQSCVSIKDSNDIGSSIGVDRYALEPRLNDNSDGGSNKAYQTLYFRYTVGRPDFDVLTIDGEPVSAKYDQPPWTEMSSVPIADAKEAQKGINGFVLANVGQASPTTVFYDNFNFKIYAKDYKKADLNGDSKVDFTDFAFFAQQWLDCNNPDDPNCD